MRGDGRRRIACPECDESMRTNAVRCGFCQIERAQGRSVIYSLVTRAKSVPSTRPTPGLTRAFADR